MPTPVDSKTEWSLKVLTKRLDCKYDPRHLLGHELLGMYTKLEPQEYPRPRMRIHPGMSLHPVLSLHGPSPPPTFIAAILLLFHLLDHRGHHYIPPRVSCESFLSGHPAVHWIHWKDFGLVTSAAKKISR